MPTSLCQRGGGREPVQDDTMAEIDAIKSRHGCGSSAYGAFNHRAKGVEPVLADAVVRACKDNDEKNFRFLWLSWTCPSGQD
jgi:hypothetical protein